MIKPARHPPTIVADAAGLRFSVADYGQDCVTFFPQGGGFQCSMGRAEFDRTFSRADRIAPHFEPCFIFGEFMVDDTRDPAGFLPAYADPNCRWNGWMLPYFPVESVKRICEAMQLVMRVPPAPIFVPASHDGADDESFPWEKIVVAGIAKPVEVCPLGAGDWIWSLAMPFVSDLARTFSRKLAAYCGPANMTEIISRNRAIARGDWQKICHSHDFCDANVIMADAWESLSDLDMLAPEDEGPAKLRLRNATMEVVNAAWDLAQSREFNPGVI